MSSNDYAASYRPCLIVAHADGGYAADVSLAFRRLGWDVYQASTGPEVRRLARLLEAERVILDAELPQESGWLTCAKLTRERPGLKVVLIARETGAVERDFAAFVGASGLVGRSAGLTTLVPEVCGTPRTAAG
jgi:DNA-binding response OmpR family regulator